MISFHKESDFDTLAHSMLEYHGAHPLRDPFSSEWIVVQNFDQATWLQLKATDKEGISANSRFLLPSELFWTIYRTQNPDFPKKLASDRYPLQWAIFELLLTDEYLQNVCSIRNEKDDPVLFELRCWQVSESIADTFDQYQVFRPEMINAWENENRWYNDKHVWEQEVEEWQAYIWNKLIQKDTPTRSHAYAHLIDQLEIGFLTTDNLPERISIFGAHDVSASFHALLQNVSRHIPVHYFVKKESGDPIEHELISKLKNKETYTDIATSFFDEPLEKKQSTRADIHKDIQIHICHSIRREVQELKRTILNVLENDTEMSPTDILVAVPDIHEYEAYLRAEFGEYSSSPLPIHFPQDYKEPQHKLYAFLQDLMNLFSTRFEASAVLNICNNECIRRAFDFSEEDMLMIRRWVSETRIHWGLNQEQVRSGNHTWRRGVEKLFAGIASETQSIELVHGISAYSHMYSRNDIERAAKLSRIIRVIEGIIDEANEYKRPSQWFFEFIGATKQLCVREDAQLIAELFERINEDLHISDIQASVSFNTILECIKERIPTSGSAASAFGRGIMISSYTPLQAVPFKFVAVLGLNDGVLPGRSHRPYYDLMQLFPIKGDRDVRLEGYMEFLNLYESAQGYMYASYTGLSEFDETERPPSIVLQHVIDYLKEAEVSSKIYYHKLQPFSSHYFSTSSDMSNYDSTNEEVLTVLSSPNLLNSGLYEESIQAIEISDSISINDLYRFFNNSSKYLCNNILNINTYDTYIPIEDEEITQFSGLDAYRLQELLKESKDISHHDLAAIARSKEMLPQGYSGDLKLKEIEQSFLPLWDRIIDEVMQHEQKLIEVTIPFNDGELFGSIEITGNELLHIANGSLKPRHIMRLWIELLVLCSIDVQIDGARLLYIDREKNNVRYLAFPYISNAKTVLQQLFIWSKHAVKDPTKALFFEHTSYAYYRELHASGQRDEALAKALQVWQGNAFSAVTPESQDYYSQLIHGENIEVPGLHFEQNAKIFWEPIFKIKKEGDL